MPKLTGVVARFKKTLNTVTGIKSFVFDNLSAMNADRDKDYPLLLLLPPTSQNASDDGELKDWDIDFFVFIPEMEADERPSQEKWDEMEALGVAVLDDILSDSPTYYLVNPETEPKIDRNRHKHNDQLIGVRFRFKLRAHYGC